jgi:uncharacterized DUF497 family protein
MKFFDWNEEKNKILIMEREVSFEDVLIAIESDNLLKIIKHPNKKKYSNQKIFIVNIRNYAYLVPFVEDSKKIFLKTIIPSRKATKKYLVKGAK